MMYWNIFWRTFAQLAAAALIAVQGLDFVTSDGLRNNGLALGLAILAAFIGAAVAVLIAFATSPASTSLEKALRSAAEKLAGGLGVVVVSEVGDLIALPKVLLAVVVAAVLAFLITYFQNQGVVPQPAGTQAT